MPPIPHGLLPTLGQVDVNNRSIVKISMLEIMEQGIGISIRSGFHQVRTFQLTDQESCEIMVASQLEVVAQGVLHDQL